MAKKGFRKTSHEQSNFELQITALIDTLVILLIFMLKTTAMESLELDQTKDLYIPMVHDGISTSTKEAKLSISKDGIFWNDDQFVFTEGFRPSESDGKVSKIQWQQFSAAIAETAKVKKEESEKPEFKGKLYLEADKNTPFPMLDRALKTARQHGFSDIRFVGARYN